MSAPVSSGITVTEESELLKGKLMHVSSDHEFVCELASVGITRSADQEAVRVTLSARNHVVRARVERGALYVTYRAGSLQKSRLDNFLTRVRKDIAVTLLRKAEQVEQAKKSQQQAKSL